MKTTRLSLFVTISPSLLLLPSVGASEIGHPIAEQIDVLSYQDYLDNSLLTHDGNNNNWDGPDHDPARDNIQAIFASFGLQAELESFVRSGREGENVVATQVGILHPETQYVIGTHYNSVQNPGADDDASGVAALLEIARVLSQYDTAYTIKYIAFDQEELGMKGSAAYVDDHEGDDIRGMLQMDMIAWNAYGRVFDVRGRSASDPLKNAAADAIDHYGNGLSVNFGGTSDYSDHAPFESTGYLACLLIERRYEYNPCYHEACDSVDTPDYIDYEYAADLTRSVAGFLADHAGATEACVGDLDTDDGVDLADLAQLLSHYGMASGASYEDGDLDSDGDVDLNDLAALLGEFGCNQWIPAPPTDLRASDGTAPHKVIVHWQVAPLADEYRVYRHTHNDPDASTPITDWQAAPTFDDMTTEPGQEYWYWVQARNAFGESEWSKGDAGYRHAPTTLHVPGEHLTIQAALDAALDGDEVPVANGVYTGPDNTELDFAGKSIIVRSENGPAHCTIDCEGTARGFVFNDGETSAAVADGFTITNGAGSYGGGVNCANGSEPTIRNCIITHNSSSSGGGGVNCGTGTYPTLINCIVSANSSDIEGGGVRCSGSSVLLANCTIADNNATSRGSGLQLRSGSTTTVINCAVQSNTASSGQAVSVEGSSTLAVSYSAVSGGQAAIFVGGGSTLSWGEGMAHGDPLLVDPNAGDYHLGPGSPCIDAGDPLFEQAPDDRDIDRQWRVWDGDGDGQWRVDIGADEFASHHPGDLDADNDVDLFDLAALLGHYGATAGMTPAEGDADLDGDIDGADLLALLAIYGTSYD